MTDDELVNHILKRKKGAIKSARLPKGFPGWDQIGDVTWGNVKERAANNEPGFRELKKLLGDRRFDK
ncbi:MAG: hypothetical protein ACR2PL_10545 [Dehalococcoidia bacterium]